MQKAKIDTNGHLHVFRDKRGWIAQYCPYQTYYKCGDDCPKFEKSRNNSIGELSVYLNCGGVWSIYDPVIEEVKI